MDWTGMEWNDTEKRNNRISDFLLYVAALHYKRLYCIASQVANIVFMS